jgi:hypothetical protein
VPAALERAGFAWRLPSLDAMLRLELGVPAA